MPDNEGRFAEAYGRAQRLLDRGAPVNCGQFPRWPKLTRRSALGLELLAPRVRRSCMWLLRDSVVLCRAQQGNARGTPRGMLWN